MEVLYHYEILSTTRLIQLINKKEFAKVALDKNFMTFVLYIITLEATKLAGIAIYLLQVAQVVTLQ